MKSKDFADLVEGVSQMKAVLRGQLAPAREMELTPAELAGLRRYRGPRPSPQFIAAKVRAIRKRLGLSQPQFAALLRVPAATLQNWEQARRRPEGPAMALLLVADHAPRVVLEALHAHVPRRKSA